MSQVLTKKVKTTSKINGSLNIYKKEQKQKSLPAGSRQFICSSNVTVQDLYVWIADGYKGLNSAREIVI